MNGIELDFKSFYPAFEFSNGILGDIATAKSPFAFAYMNYIKAHAFGPVHTHSKFVAANLLKTEEIQAFYDKHYLYVIRTIDNDSRVFRFYAETELLFCEAVKIVKLHQEMSSLDLQDF